MRIHSRSNRAKFHPDRRSNFKRRSIGFLVAVAHQVQQEEEEAAEEE